jgi:membrane protease YdiL (CAAX protease family)
MISLKPLWFNDSGLRSGWSAALFVSTFLLLELTGRYVLSCWVSLKPSGPIPPALAFLREVGEVLAVAGATGLMACIERKSPLSYGFSPRNGFARVSFGALWGLLSLSTLIGMLWLRGALVFEGWDQDGMRTAGFAASWAIVFLLVGIFEESLLRGYLQFTLGRTLGFWWAALLLSAIFALEHTRNGGESVVGVLTVGAGGLLFCLSLWYTKSLWWAIGFHAGWDWGQSFLFGTPNSGLIMKGHLLVTHAAGSPLWSGGSAGPEATALVVPVLLSAVVGMWLWWGRGRIPRAASS